MQRDGWINLPAHGNSMFPFIQKGDICKFIECEPSSLKKGDIVLFHLSNGHLVGHRLYQVIIIGNQIQYQCKGDTNLGIDEPIRFEQIIGKLTSVQKRWITFEETDVSAFVWKKIIVSFPGVSGMLRKYLNGASL